MKLLKITNLNSPKNNFYNLTCFLMKKLINLTIKKFPLITLHFNDDHLLKS